MRFWIPWGIAAAVLLMIVRRIVDKILLPGTQLDNEIRKDQNWGAALIEVASAIGISLLIQGAFF